jgi:cilia- and flagella-associated protein 52
MLGKVRDSLHYSPCGRYLVYPLGSLIVIKHIKSEKEAFLDGHNSEISCLRISHDGSSIASGQVNFPGVKVRSFFSSPSLNFTHFTSLG